MLYSIGKDSAVMLQLAMNAFYPGKPPLSPDAARHHVEIPRPHGPKAGFGFDRPHQFLC
jgi:hypothetical protein